MRKEILKFVVLALLALGAPPAYSAYWQWSRTASSNAGADPSINWAEGMSPSSVNDSARAMMARAAEQRDDISGLLTTSGSSTAYTVATNQGLNTPTPTDGQMISVTIHATNGANPTMAADGGTAFAIQSSPGISVPVATLIAGSPYSMRFSVANSAWMLRDFYGSALTVPLGGLVPYTLTTVPNSNFVFPAGQCISTTTYAVYWVALGSPASGTCAGGQFRIIDLSGSTLAGLDTMPGFSAANRLTSSSFGCGTAMTSVGARCANGVESATTSLAQLPSITSSGTVTVFPGGLTTNFVPVAVNSVFGYFNLSSTPNCVINCSPFTGLSAAGGTNSFSGVNSMTSTNTLGQAHPTVPPIVGVTYLLRVL